MRLSGDVDVFTGWVGDLEVPVTFSAGSPSIAAELTVGDDIITIR